jgi:bifunctional non-homologous end joining protein LigD
MRLEIPAGRRVVAISRPDKPLFPCGMTKADLAEYYRAVAPAMLPHVAGRPLNLERFPDGIEGPRIIQQRAGGHFPGWIQRVTVPKRGGTVEHVVASDAATLVYLADQACITLHAWLSRADRPEVPDRMILDLDPADDDTTHAREAALDIGMLLRELGLEPFAMATGSRGYHVTVPLRRRAGFDEVRGFARDVARVAVARDPRLTVEQRKAARGGRVLVDVMRNAYAHTAVAAYAVRPRPGAPVAAPLRWEELSDAGTRPDGQTLRTMPGRLEREGDPWADIGSFARALGTPRRRLERLLRDVGQTSRAASQTNRAAGRTIPERRCAGAER